jgi:hypothetical protein
MKNQDTSFLLDINLARPSDHEEKEWSEDNQLDLLELRS